MKVITGFLLVIASMITLTACEHTVQGFGQDMQHNGEKIEKST